MDGGPDTERIGRVAGAIAVEADARLRLVTVAEVAGGPGPASAGTIGYVTLSNASRDRATNALDRAASAVDADVPVERRVAGGRVGGAVAALSADADLLVIGSRSYGPLRRVVAGTHTGSIMHGASVPVLVLPRGAGGQHDEHVAGLAAATARAQPAAM